MEGTYEMVSPPGAYVISLSLVMDLEVLEVTEVSMSLLATQLLTILILGGEVYRL